MLFRSDPWGEEMATCSSIPAWKIPWTKEPGGLQSMGSQRVHTEQLHFQFSLSCIGEGNGNPLQCSCLEIPHGQRSLAGCSPWGRKESDRTERQHARTLLIWDLGTRFTCVHFRTFKLSEIKFQRAREVIFPEGGHMASTWPQGASGPWWPVQPSTG